MRDYDALSRTIAEWCTYGDAIDVHTIGQIARDADALGAQTPGMHDTRVNIAVTVAFDGFGDVTGSNEYGVSVAWLDLADISDYGIICDMYADDMPGAVGASDYGATLGAYLATWREIDGARYALAYWDESGARSLEGFATHDAMMTAYRAHESAYLAWLGDDDDA